MQLFINTYGAYLHVRDSIFEVTVRNGEEVKKTSFAPKKITSFLLSPGTGFSSDAVKLALVNNIDMLFLDTDGTPLGRVWHSKLGSTTKIRKRQLIVSIGKDAVQFIKDWVTTKIRNQADFLGELKRHRSEKADYLNEKIEFLNKEIAAVLALEANTIGEIADQLRGFEGTAGRIYFETLSSLLAKEYTFPRRSTRPAADSFNAFLNYAYGVLYGKVEKALIIAGIDPYLGFFHRDDYNQMSMVFDFIEPYRTYADEVVFRLFSAKKVNQSHTDQIVKGVSLNKEGKMLLMDAFVKFFDSEQIRYRGRNQTRSNTILFDAHSFASKLLGTSETTIDITRIDELLEEVVKIQNEAAK